VIDLDEDGDLDMVMRTFEGGEKLNGLKTMGQNLHAKSD
jgi:hypothetical protein